MHKGHIAFISILFAGLIVGGSAARADDAAALASISPSAGHDPALQEILNYRSSGYDYTNSQSGKPRFTLMQGKTWNAGLGSAPTPYLVKDKTTHAQNDKFGAAPFFSLKYRFRTE